MPTSLTSDRLYCTGFWHLPSNQKRDLAHYERLLPLTMQMLRGGRLHLYCGDAETEERFRVEASKNDVELSATWISLEDLPTAQEVSPILDTCERLVTEGWLDKEMNELEKLAEHLKKDFRRSGRETFGHLLAIWTSKIPLLSRLSREVGDSVGNVVWADASVSRFNAGRTNWDFRKQSWPVGKVGHYKSRMLYQGHALPLNASFLGASPKVWPEIETLFLAELRRRAADGYIHDEETILSHVIKSAPERFHRIGVPVRGLQRLPWKFAYMAQGLR